VKSCSRDDVLVVTPEEAEAVIRFPVGGQMIGHRCRLVPLTEATEFPVLSDEPVDITGLKEPLVEAFTGRCENPKAELPASKPGTF